MAFSDAFSDAFAVSSLSYDGPALMYARLGIIRLGASRLGYYQPIIRIDIGGINRTELRQVRVLSVRIGDYLDSQPNTATFRVSGFTPTKGHEVKIGLGNTVDAAQLVFAGHILNTTQAWDTGRTAHVAWDVQAISYEWLLNRLKVNRRFTSESATDIILSLMADFTSGFDVSGVEDDLPDIDEIQFTDEEMTQALDRIMRRIGGYWKSTEGKVLKAFLTETEYVHEIEDADTHSMFPQPQINADLSQVKTRVVVEGGGSNASVPVLAGSSVLPVDDPQWYDPDVGGFVKVGQQRVQYGSVSDGGTGALVGTSLTPTNGPTPTPSGGTGLSTGNYDYAVTFQTAAGETLPSPQTTVDIDSALTSAPSTIGTASNRPNNPPTYYTSDQDVGAVYGYKYTIYDPVSGAETTPSPATTHTTTASPILPSKAQQVRVSKSGVITPPSGTTLRFYRTEGGGATYKLLPNGTTHHGFLNSDSDYYYDIDPDSALGADAPSSNTLTRARVTLTNIAIGPATTTGRKIYRTVADGSQLKLVTTIADNTTTTYTDSTVDGSLGADVPTADTSGLASPFGEVAAGSTSIIVTSTAPFLSGGGWAYIGNLPIRYTGFSGSSLTGVPSSGIGALTTTVRYGSELIGAPMLTGIPTSGEGSILYDIPQGEPVNILVIRDDEDAQDVMAAAIGTEYGIWEEVVKDNRLSIVGATERGDARLAEVKDPLVTVNYVTRDQTTKSGKSVTFNLGAPTNLSGTFKIQSVTLENFDPSSRLFPTRTVQASSRRLSFEALLRIIQQQTAV